ncbi:DHA2 family efflux MFS transporter permease subunit [Protaetiibacter sp. WY-16]|uniref:DHA2 family efflux MFS transporter permease subunit n=1 Tax=Antiquaquibacter soli TaxID=3064523 RepID=A0ABT9BLA2_9MICO|nr:DHA2 family efflux MFS transporter permease subunit [Protaetiibacter sp. WY-16]MDO7881774.1 DHA2 family efflux MFS transporter permease subunit [Protaetiibacter sp. WY-16]
MRLPTAADAQPDHSRRNRVVIALMLAATFVVFLNETIIGNALPDLMRELEITASTAQWLSTAFMLTMAIVIPVTGFLMTRLTTRTVFILAMSLFSAGTALAAVAPGFEILLAGRVVQASGTAIMMPLLMTTVMTLVPPHERGKTMGNISIVMSVAPAAGPAISGVILSVFDWRWIFILVLPIALGALALGASRVQNVTEPRKVPVDVLSVVLSAFAFGGLIYGLSSLGEAARGETFVAPWIPILVGLVALGAFVWRQLSLEKADKALLDLRTFASRGFTISIVIMMVMMAALFGTIILLPIYTQDVLGLDVLGSGLMLVPGSLLMGFAGPFVGRLYDRVGPRPLILPGAIWVSVVLWSMAMLLNATSPVWLVLALHIALCVGLAFMFTPLFTSALGSLRPQLYSHGSATIGTVQQLAGAAGTALFIALLTVGSVAGEAAGASEIDALASGIHTAFLAGAIISLFAIVAAAFVPKPDPELVGAGMHGGH